MRQPRLRVRVRQRRRDRRSWTLCRWACIRSRCRGRLIPVHCVGCSHHPRARQHFDTRCCEHRVFVCTGAFSPPKDSTTTPLVGSRNRLGPHRPWLRRMRRRGVPQAVRRLAETSISPNHPRPWGASPPLTPGSAGRPFEDATLAAYLGELHDHRRAPSEHLAGGRRGALPGQSRRRARDRGRGQARPFGATDLAAILATCRQPQPPRPRAASPTTSRSAPPRRRGRRGLLSSWPGCGRSEVSNLGSTSTTRPTSTG